MIVMLFFPLRKNLSSATSRAECLVEKGMIHHKGRNSGPKPELYSTITLPPPQDTVWIIHVTHYQNPLSILLVTLFSLPQDTSTSRAECLVEKGMIHHKARDFRRACTELAQAVKLDPLNSQVRSSHCISCGVSKVSSFLAVF